MKLPKSESLIILVFIGCVALWAVSKCAATRSNAARRMRDLAADEEHDERPARRDTVVLTQPAPAPSAPVNVQGPGAATPQPSMPTAAPSAAAPVTLPGKTPQRQSAAPPPQPAAAATNKYSTLYVTIDGLKMRKQPSLKGDLVAKLELYEPVFFLNQKTEKTEEISLGYEKVTDHWVKVRTKEGKEGWVFGAGVHYYKMKRKGVME